MGRGQQQAIVTFQDRLHRPVDGSLLVVALVLAGGMIEGREGAFADLAWPGTALRCAYADHSFYVPARSGTNDRDVMRVMLEDVAAWMLRLV
jgi:hypothetical protein